MGTSSSEILRQPLGVLPRPVASINACVCDPEPLTLHMREQPSLFGKDDFVIREADSGNLLFRVDTAALSVSDRKVLLDAHDQPIVHMRDQLLAFRHTFNISADYNSEQMLFRIKAHVTLFDNDLECAFHDVVHGAECRVGVVGEWRARAVLIWLDQDNGVKLPVARVYRPAPEARKAILGKHDYYMDIAPNVDMALMVLVCIALDDAKNDHSLSSRRMGRPLNRLRRGLHRVSL
jgi:uncharacterized protein YxjI